MFLGELTKGRLKARFVITVLGTRRIYEGRVLNLRVDDVVYPNGNRSNVEVVEHNGGVCIIAQPEPGKIVLVKQFRPAIGRELWEVPAGKLDSPGEDPAAAARRELVEETGYRCKSIRKLWTFYTAPGFCSELLHLFVADGVTAGTPEPEADEVLQAKVFEVAQAWAMVERDEIPDAKTQIALSWARTRAS
jgi:ADP-ribose diphosphatase